MQRLLLICILAVILLGGLVLLWPDDGGQTTRVSSAQVAHDSGLQLEPASLRTNGLPAQAERSARVEQALGIKFLAWPEFEGPRITVEVWNRKAQAPAPFATVFLETMAASFKDAMLRDDFHEWLLEHAEVYQADALGRIQAPRDWLLRNTYAESKEGLWGSFRLQESEYRDTVRIDLLPVHDITVQVVDEDQVSLPNVVVHLASSQYSGIQPWRQANTNQAGKAILKRVPYQILGLHRINGYAIMAGNPPATGQPEFMDLKDIPDAITIVMHPTAMLQVQAFDASGTPIEMLPAISVRLLGNNPSGKLWSDSGIFQTWVKDAAQGLITVTVPADHPFELGIDFDECSEAEYFPFEAIKAGERITAELHQEKSHPTIRFRLVDQDGNVFSNRAFTPAIKAEYDMTYGFYSHRISLTTTEDGYGEFQLPHANLHAGKQLLKGRYLQARISSENGVDFEGILKLDKAFELGIHDLGDWVLDSATREIFATGYVLDTDGNPLVGTKIDAGASVTTSTGVHQSSTGRRSFGRTEVDDHGHFILYAKRPKDWSKVTLRAIRTGYPWKKVPLLAPGQEHRIVLDAGNIIRGQVLLPLGMEQQGISLEFIPYSDSDAQPHDPYTETSATDGLFRLTELPAEAGIVTIGLGLSWPFHPVATIENVFPWKIGQEGDPRLARIDLRESVGIFQVTAVDEHGEPLNNAQFSYVMRRKNGSSSRGIPNRNGTAIILAPETKFEVTVGAAGYRTQDLDLVDPTTIVALQPALAIHCQLAWMPRLTPGREVILALTPVDGSASRDLIENIAFDANGEMQSFISRPGQFEVSLGIQVNHGWSAERLFDANGDRVIIHVPESKDLQNFHFDPPKSFYDPLLLPADRKPTKD